MNNRRLILLVVCIGCYVTTITSQNYRIDNKIGIYGGLTSYNINTDNFVTKSNSGWLVGMAATVDLPHRWYNVSYNIQLSENKLDFAASPVLSAQQEMVTYKVFAAQVTLMGHLKLVGNNLTIDAGPMLQYNGNLNIQDENQSNYILQGYNTLTAEDISEISKFHVNGAIGISVGIDWLKVRGQYIYGFTNIFNRLNDDNLVPNSDFRGNQNMLVFSAMLLF